MYRNKYIYTNVDEKCLLAQQWSLTVNPSEITSAGDGGEARVKGFGIAENEVWYV